MDGLRVVPARRGGRQWLYVTRVDGTSIAWYDRDSGRVSLLGAERQDAVMKVLSPFLTGPVTVGPPPVPTRAEIARLALHPDDDLAPNRPGETLLLALDRAPGTGRRLRTDTRRRALAAEQAVGDALDTFESAGWRTLHSVQLPGGDRISHLFLGPGGVFALQSLAAKGRKVKVTATTAAVGRHGPEPLRQLRSCAERAGYALATEVQPVLALLGPAAVDVTRYAGDIRVTADSELATLARLGGVLKPADVEALYALARDRHTWLRV